MSLTFKIVSRHRQALGEKADMTFGQAGGTIGRSLEADWSLPDSHRFMSSRHASIDFRSGCYYIVDTSKNGVFINDAADPVGHGKPQRLFPGDRIRIGEYEMEVAIANVDDTRETLLDSAHIDPVDLKQRVDSPDPTSCDLVDAEAITGVGIEMFLEDDDIETLKPLYDKFKTDSSDRLELVEPPAQSQTKPATAKPAPARTAPARPAPARPAPAAPAFKPAAPRAPAATASSASASASAPASASASAPASAPASASASASASAPAATAPTTAAAKPSPARSATPIAAKPKPANAPAARPAAAASAAKPSAGAAPVRPAAFAAKKPEPAAPRGAIEAFFHGAGIDMPELNAKQTEQLMSQLGQVTRELIVGVIDCLHLRALQKAQLKQSNTTIQPLDNNRLKFAANVEEGFERLFSDDAEQYLSPVESIRNTFDDLKNHQRGLLKATRHALEEYLDRLEPEQLEQRAAGGRSGALINAANKLRYWDLYKDVYAILANRPADDLPQPFLDAMAQAYAEESIKASPRSRTSAARKEAG